ncbi:hypothetical protein C8T65DRAFT_695622 [Cerioporus squamosus]|nr:hypothetical protein C8T65DRAFT_695622 [Cerioporus squamosus]
MYFSLARWSWQSAYDSITRPLCTKEPSLKSDITTTGIVTANTTAVNISTDHTATASTTVDSPSYRRVPETADHSRPLQSLSADVVLENVLKDLNENRQGIRQLQIDISQDLQRLRDKLRSCSEDQHNVYRMLSRLQFASMSAKHPLTLEKRPCSLVA